MLIKNQQGTFSNDAHCKSFLNACYIDAKTNVDYTKKPNQTFEDANSQNDPKIPLVKETIDNDDIDNLIDWLKGYPHLTKGKETIEFEKQWSKFMGVNYSVFVNSGSSAILLMLYALIESGELSRGDKVVVPAVSWATDLAPVIQLGLEPVLCDCNLEDLSIDINHFKTLVNKKKPKVLILVSVLGLVPAMDNITEICDLNDVILLEDVCEGLGSAFQHQKLGTFGLMSAFSTYFGHHISTIEGGVISTNDVEIYNILKSIRSHGWDRDMDENHRDKLRKDFPCNDFQSLYKFYYCGFNMRSTDLQAYLGILQIKKLQKILESRAKNYKLYRNLLSEKFWKPVNGSNGDFVSNFSYPVITPVRQLIIDELSAQNIATRPLISGSMENQPFWKKRENKKLNLKNANVVDAQGMYLPNNHQITVEEIERICSIVNQFA